MLDDISFSNELDLNDFFSDFKRIIDNKKAIIDSVKENKIIIPEKDTTHLDNIDEKHK